MTDFVNFITDNIETFEKGELRQLSGHISAEVVDHQNDFILVKEILDVMDVFMKHLPVLSEVHSNRMIGKIDRYEKSMTDGHDSVKIYATIFKDDRVSLYDDVWNKIKSGVYTGLSMGGGSKNREPMMKNGKMVMNLKNLELYEIAVCPSPANPLALIDKYNEFAKSDFLMSKSKEIDTGKNIVQCTSIGCAFNKGINDDVDNDIDNANNPKKEHTKGDASNSSEIGEDTRRVPNKEEEDLEQFDKPDKTVKKDHIPSVSESKEESARDKIREEDVEDKQDRTNLKKGEEEQRKFINAIITKHIKRLNGIIKDNKDELSRLEIAKKTLI